MAQVWKCTCGETFPEHGFEFTRHIKEGRQRGEEHHSAGLVDDETGETLARTLPEAVQKGLVPRSKKRRGKKGGDHEEPSGDGREVTAVKGRFVTQEVLLDGRLLLLYDLARERFPDYDGNIGEWLWDIVIQFHVEHADELGFTKLFEDSVKLEVERG